MPEKISFEPFVPAHLSRLDLRPDQAEFASFILSMDADALVGPWTWAAVLGGRVVGIGGIARRWQGCASAWTLAGDIPRREWGRITAMVRLVLADARENGGFHRIECSVLSSYAAGHRWAVRLGFVREGRAQAYDPWRNDHDIYAMVTS